MLFRDAVDSGCGYAPGAMGPFYCPRDQKVYVDLGFFDELRSRFGAPGDFAQAYVLAHEIGHHVQNQLGIERAAARAAEREPVAGQRALGAHGAAGRLPAPASGRTRPRAAICSRRAIVEEGLAAASAVGDDRIQEMATGEVRPEAFTHGSSEQRVTLVPARLRVRRPATPATRSRSSE